MSTGPRKTEKSLRFLEVQGVGPAKQLRFEPAPRLNLITGDNGLGKTFLLDCAWWALTGFWAGRPAYPRSDAATDEVKITFSIAGGMQGVSYDWPSRGWPSDRRDSETPGLSIYGRVDGSFALWDPAWDHRPSLNVDPESKAFRLSQEQIWDGDGRRIPGLMFDWLMWQNNPEKYPQFEIFKRVLARLSPPSAGDLGILTPGDAVRIPYDPRECPTLRHPYGDVPILYVAAGVKRILTMAYVLVWAWEEHKVQSGLIRRAPEQRMVVLIDEMEAHLHPQWQRRILPALLSVQQDLANDLDMQLLVATHSPLIIASAEPEFDEEKDKLFHLDLDTQGNVVLEELPFIRRGRYDAWLTSDVFELKQSLPLEAEAAVENAKALQLQDNPDPDEIRLVSDQLAAYLSETDKFWPRWTYFAEQHGVTL